MAEGTDDDDLREAARNRGIRLIKSRKRKAGVGDYGKFGLADQKGNALYGVDPDGTLTASAQDVAGYLRKGDASTWAESARVTPANPKPEPSPAKREASAPADQEQTPAKRSAEAPLRRRTATARSTSARATPSRRSPARAIRTSTTRPAPRAVPPPAPSKLVVRAARKADAAAIAKLSAIAGGDGDDRQIEIRIAAALRAKEPLLVADRGGVVAVLHGHVVTAIHHGPVGRITLIVVAEGERRSGIGRALLDEATAAFARANCACIEAMSEIAVRNANAFFRSMGFAQASYRFIRDI